MLSTSSPDPAAKSRGRRNSVAALVLLAILCLSAFLRFDGLGEIDFRGDEVSFFFYLQEGADPVESLGLHLRDFGHDRQMPLPRVLGAAIVKIFRLPIDAHSTRMPFALAGVAASLAFWILGWQLAAFRRAEDAKAEGAKDGPMLALAATLGLFVAVNPFHLYWSRTAHIYAYAMLFLGVALACTVGWLRTLERGREMEPAGRWWLSGVAAGLILASYSHMSAWIASGLVWLFLLVAWCRQRHQLGRAELRSWGRELWRGKPWPRALLAATLLWALSLAPWAWQFLAGLLGESYDPVWNQNTNPFTRFEAMWRVPFIMTWGGGWRSVLTLGLPAAACLIGWRHPRFSSTVKLTAGVTVTLFVALSVAQTTGFFAVRSYVPLWPLLMVASGLGALMLAERLQLASLGRLGRWTLPLLAVVPSLAMLSPVRALMELRGNPVEFSRLAETLDATFKKGTPALVNGMNVVLFEMRPHPPKKVAPTFTVPDVGLGMWRDNDWRLSAQEFAKQFPDAPLVQQGRNYYDHPEIGPWSFPQSHFSEHIELRNEPALLLRRLLLAGSLDFYSTEAANSRAVTHISYNSPSDIADRARAEGKDAVAIFGDGWRFLKTDDLSSWRVVEKRASILLHQLGPEAVPIQLTLHCQSVNGLKELRILSDDGEQIGEAVLTSWQGAFSWRFTIEAAPGVTTLELVDELYDVGRTPLLVSRLEAVRAVTP